MKNLKNIFTMALVTTCMSACTGFLDIEPETTLTGKNFYKSPDDIRSALYSTYSSLRDNGLYSASIYLFGDVRSDVAFPNQTNYYANTFRHEIEKFTISANNSGNQNYWAHHYKGIIRANTVIEKGKELFGNDEAVQKYIAEAEVLRALFYFNLVRAYGGVPIIMDIPQEYTDSRGHLRASAEEVYIRILTDLTTAIESNNLYRSTNNGEKTPTGRVNKYAAEALLGKVLLSMPNDITEAAYPNVEAWKDISANPNITVFYPETTTTQYEAAKYYLEDVINNGGYELYPNFSELFKPTNKHSSESIWEVEYKTGQAEGLGSPFYTLFSPASYAPRNKANSNGYIPSPISNQGNGACAPTGYFMDMAKKWDSMYPDYQYEVRKFDDVIYTDTRISDGNIKLDTDGISYLPVNENNLIYKAYKLMKDEYGFSGGIEVDLNKFIPIAAGMAGGSTDAASAMFAINKLFNLGLSNRELMEQGVKIGADVPYCIMRGTALAEGIGEKLTRLAPMPFCHMVVAKPPINVSTKMVYDSLDSGAITKHPDIDGIIEAINEGSVIKIAERMGNVLEDVTIPLYPVIDKIKKDMISQGAYNAMMSGSGPTVFGIFPDEQTALNCKEYLKRQGDARQVYITETFN